MRARADEKHLFEFYHNGVTFRTRVRGKKRYLAEKAYLDALVGLPPSEPSWPPVPNRDFYVLDDEQLKAYSEFRRRQSRAERGF